MKAVATASSMALPSAFSISTPAVDACLSVLTTTPLVDLADVTALSDCFYTAVDSYLVG